MSDELRGAQAEDKEWELLGGEPGETSKPRSASELVESFWRKATGASGAEAAQSTRMSCEDVIERSEAALSSQILGGGAEESRASGEEGEGEGRLEEGEESRQNGNYRLFGPLRTRVESALAAVLYGFGANDSAQPNALADVLSSPNVAKLIENRTALSLGLLNLVLCLSLVQSSAKNQKLRTEVDKRGRLIYKLVSKLYESKIQYNNVPTPQYHYSIALSM
ncbi:hypothetical protein HKI87_11g66160 [Chloropicon roscoffensis]|uniref:Uncharacterized protein n=1 Tax=Chloropicon roscoffensis TaxID=1461544 RepID=A0AAX4PH44_9CHLO